MVDPPPAIRLFFFYHPISPLPYLQVPTLFTPLCIVLGGEGFFPFVASHFKPGDMFEERCVPRAPPPSVPLLPFSSFHIRGKDDPQIVSFFIVFPLIGSAASHHLSRPPSWMGCSFLKWLRFL